jgi:uncharacterized membrane protein
MSAFQRIGWILIAILGVILTTETTRRYLAQPAHDDLFFVQSILFGIWTLLAILRVFEITLWRDKKSASP